MKLPTLKSIHDEGRELVYHRLVGTKAGGELLYVYTVTKMELEKSPKWDGTGPLPTPLEKIIAIATEQAKFFRSTLKYKSVSIEPIEGAPSKQLAIVTFADGQDHSDVEFYDREVFILLDGTLVARRVAKLIGAEYQRIWEHDRIDLGEKEE